MVLLPFSSHCWLSAGASQQKQHWQQCFGSQPASSQEQQEVGNCLFIPVTCHRMLAVCCMPLA